MARSTPRDNQRKRLYRSEWLLRDLHAGMRTILSPEEVREMVALCYDAYGLSDRLPTVYFNPRRYATCVFAYGRGDGYGQVEIGTNRRARRADANGQHWGFNAYVSIHEAAHGIIYATGMIWRVEPHGPTFARITHDLYHDILGVPRDLLASCARQYGVKVAREPFDPEAVAVKYGTLWRVNLPVWSPLVRAETATDARRIVGASSLASVEAIDNAF